MSRQTVGCLALPPTFGSHQKALFEHLSCPGLWSHRSSYGHQSGCMLNSSWDRHRVAFSTSALSWQGKRGCKLGVKPGLFKWRVHSIYQILNLFCMLPPSIGFGILVCFGMWFCVWVIRALPALLYRYSVVFSWWFSFTDICWQIKAFEAELSLQAVNPVTSYCLVSSLVRYMLFWIL